MLQLAAGTSLTRPSPAGKLSINTVGWPGSSALRQGFAGTRTLVWEDATLALLLLESLLLPCQRIFRFSRCRVIGAECEEIITMQGQAEQVPRVDEAVPSADERVSLLAEVDFKWLMAGLGWWIDTTRFHSDPSYAAGFLRLAMASQSFALRECAASLQAQIGGPAACRAGRPG